MKRALLLTLLCCFIAIANANATKTDAKTDSLLQVVKALPADSTRLVALTQIIRTELMNNRCIELADTLLNESLRQKNDAYISQAAYFHATYYYNHPQQDSVTKWLNFMLPYVQRSNNWEYYFNARRFQINLYSYQERFELAIEEATKMKQEAMSRNSKHGLASACLCMGNAYIGSQRWNEGIKSLEEAYQNLKGDELISMKFAVLTQLIYASKEVRDNAKQLKYLRELAFIAKDFSKGKSKQKTGYVDIFFYIEIYYAYYYIGTQQYPLAYKHLVQSRNFLSKNTYFMYRKLYYDAYAQYYEGIKQYDKALAYIDTTIEMTKQDIPINYAEQLLKKANILFKAGLDTEALPLYEQVQQIKDSLAISVAEKQLEQIKGSFDLSNIELEQTKLNNNIQLAGLVVIIAIVLGLLGVMLRSAHVRKALKHSADEIQKATQTVSETNKMKNNFLSNMSYNIRTPLNNVVGFSQLLTLESNIVESDRKEYANIIQSSSEELLTLVNDVLDLSRLEARMMKFQMREYDITALCNEAVYMVRMKEEQAGINIQFQTEIDSQAIQADTTRLSQSLLSALTFPKPCEQKREIQMTLSYIQDEAFVCIRVCNSPLADSAFTTQHTIIRHEINQFLWEHFGGSYQVDVDSPEGPTIVFTYPLQPTME